MKHTNKIDPKYKTWKGLGYFWNRHDFQDVKGVVHVGAHICEENEFYLDMGVRKIMYFEPLVGLYQQFWHAEHDKKPKDRWDHKFDIFEYHNCALKSFKRDDLQKFYIYEKSAMSSFLTRDDVSYQDVEVKVDALSNYDTSEYDMLVMDVQGTEGDVLEGATNEQLKDFKYIISEVNREKVYKGCSLITNLDDKLEPLGFERVDTEWCGGNWGNALWSMKK